MKHILIQYIIHADTKTIKKSKSPLSFIRRGVGGEVS
jgi:hypothetical protein